MCFRLQEKRRGGKNHHHFRLRHLQQLNTKWWSAAFRSEEAVCWQTPHCQTGKSLLSFHFQFDSTQLLPNLVTKGILPLFLCFTHVVVEMMAKHNLCLLTKHKYTFHCSLPVMLFVRLGCFGVSRAHYSQNHHIYTFKTNLTVL